MHADEPIAWLPGSRENILRTPYAIKQMRELGPIVKIRTERGHVAWLVSEYELVRNLLDDERLGRDFRLSGVGALMTDDLGAEFGSGSNKEVDARRRKLLSPKFTARRMQEKEESIRERADALIDQMIREGPPANLHEDLTRPLIIQMIAELVGIPPDGLERFHAWIFRMASARDEKESIAGYIELFEYMQEIVEFKRSNSGEDLISDLIRAEGEGRLESVEIAMYASLLVFASETTSSFVDYGMAFFLGNHEQKELLLAKPSLLHSAVEEVLRMTIPCDLGGWPCIARIDLDIAGTQVRKGDWVVLSIGANFDPAIYSNPDSMDITRSPNPHLSFGIGRRYCLGATLARLELKTVFSRIFERLPQLRLDVPLEALKASQGQLVGGISQLRVTW